MPSETASHLIMNDAQPSFVISVTGHRDLIDGENERTRQSVRETLNELKSHFDHMPLNLVTGLAAGADMLVAEIALEMDIAVTAVLPMPQDLYRSDFSGAALDQFLSLCQDDRVIVREIPLKSDRGADDLKDQKARDDQYELLKDYILRRSNALIALWDGNSTGLPGGTSDVVESFLAGEIRQSKPMHAPAESGGDIGDLVLWVPVSRKCNKKPTTHDQRQHLVSNSTGECYWNASGVPDAIASRWRGLDEFARERKSSQGRDLSTFGLLPDDEVSVSGEARAIEMEFDRADQLARANQGQSDRMFKMFGFMAGAMGFLFLVYAKLFAANIFLIVYVALFVAGFLGFRISAKKHWLGKHLSYRALAETLRVQFFLTISGAGEGYGIRRILKLTNVDRFERFDWLQDAVRCCEPLVYFSQADPDKSIELTRKYWIEDQGAYFGKKSHVMHERHRLLEMVKTTLLIGSVLGALALIFFKKTLIHLDMIGYDGKAVLVFLMGLLPLWVAIWELYQGKMATRELIWQYTNQGRFFAAASNQLKMARTPQDARQFIASLADKALIEIYLWSVHRYHREHEPPAAG